MTKEEMDIRKVRILRTLMDEDLSTVDLQYFENIRLWILEQRKQKKGKTEETLSDDTLIMSEPQAAYGWQEGVSYTLDEVPPISKSQADALKVKLTRFLFNELETEEELEDIEVVDYTIRLGDKAPCRYTREELNARADRAEAEFARGGGIPHEVVRKMIESW